MAAEGRRLGHVTMCLAKAGVENQVGVVRERFFTPRLRVASYEELNAWLLDRCVAYAKAHKHPELADCTIWQAFEAERPQLVQITGPFDGFHATQSDAQALRYASGLRWVMTTGIKRRHEPPRIHNAMPC